MRKYRDSSITSYDTFHYVTNAQGDVVQLNFQGGTVYAEYTYDAWGNILTKTGSLADVNPLRYRGYYYDTESGFYYLQSRYYDPALGRFLNADSYASTGQGFLGHNMFAYCGNNPVNAVDYTGNQMRVCSDYDWGGYYDGGGGGGGIVSFWLLGVIIDFFTSSQDPVPNVTTPVAGAQAVPQIESKSISVAAEKVEEKKRQQAYFPENPNLFVPSGLVRIDYPGSRNGAVIKWSVPGFRKIVIFEWDEDLTYGSHYHVMTPVDKGKHGELVHWKAGDPVPEPWNSLYFSYLGG